MALFVSEVPFWEGASRGGFTICDTQNLLVFSARHSFAELVECKLKNNINLPKIGGCLPTCKKVFFGLVFVVWWFGFLFLLFLFFFVWKKPQKNHFLQFYSLFSFCVPNFLSLKSFFSCILFCFFVFLLSPLSKFHIFLWCLSINPF